MAEERHVFQAEVSKLLDIVAHSLYSHKEIFLRELVSNASDACDRLRHEALTRPELVGGDADFRMRIEIDKAGRKLTVADNGIGMNRQEVSDNLGTIARSGTQAFVEQLAAGAGKSNGQEVALIGQFGVGFYSAFMVAEKVEVLTRRAGEDEAWLWTSDGRGEYTIAEAERPERGTSVTLHLGKDEDEFLDPGRLRSIVTTYSDHIGFPILLVEEAGKEEKLNEASALWTRPAKEITEEQYTEFYRHIGHALDEPWKTLHNKIEGALEYTNLLFIPKSRPWDLFDPERKPRLKLYVKRVFITDDCEALLPAYLRFMRGIVDSEDLSLNISREMLQKDPKLAKIRSGLVKRVLGELTKTAKKSPEDYVVFWENFGAVLKEGLYEEFQNRDEILALSRFRSTGAEGWTSLEDYVGRMKEGQDAIFYVTGEDADSLRRSPQLEGFRAREVEVLLLTDPIDDFWLSAIGQYADKPFRSVTRGGADLEKIKAAPEDQKAEEKAPDAPGLDRLVAAIKLALGDSVKDVRTSSRLTESAVCLVADEGDIDMRLERLLRQHKQLGMADATPRVLEINPRHPLIQCLAGRAADNADGGELDDAAHLLLDQARIIEGEALPDPVAFARRLSMVMERGMAGSAAPAASQES